MADKAEVMKWFAGREVEVLDDQKGRTTVSAWREQLLNAAARMCGATGRKMLHGEFPKIEADEYYTPRHIMNIINDVFKRSKTREKMNNWFIEDDDGNMSLTWFGYNEYKVQVSTIAEDLLGMIMLTLKEGSNAATYLKSLMRRSGTAVRSICTCRAREHLAERLRLAEPAALVHRKSNGKYQREGHGKGVENHAAARA